MDTIPGESGLGALATDGQNLWVVGGSNKVYECGSGPCVVAFTQPPFCFPFTFLNCDALEYFTIPGTPYSKGALISRGGVTFLPDSLDAYDLTGKLLAFAFLRPNYTVTGVAWDGTDFYTADVSSPQPQLEKFSNSGGGPVGTPLVLTGIPSSYPAKLQDLSINYGTLPCHNPVDAALSSSLYDNGPVDGQTAAWDIEGPAGGPTVSDKFVIGSVAPPNKTVNGFCFGVWLPYTDDFYTLDWSISSLPNNQGTVYASGTASVSGGSGGTLTAYYLFTNSAGYNVNQSVVSFLSSVVLSPGTYWLNVTNAFSYEHGVLWDQNNGVGCTSKGPLGCPSTAFYFDSAGCSAGCPIPSESLTLR